MTTSTVFSTSDLSCYWAALRETPFLKKEEETMLLSVLSSEDASQEECRHAREYLLLSYLRWAARLIKEQCPRSLWGTLLPDLIGDVNLTLCELFARADLPSIGDKFPSYVAATVRSTTSEGLSCQYLIRVPYQARIRAREQGTWEQLHKVERVLSFDALMEVEESHEGEEPLAFPVHSGEGARQCDPALHALLEQYLSYLSARTQMILRLRYGLYEENERCHSMQEVADLLGTTRDVVKMTQRQAFEKIRALIEGRALLILHHGKPTISYPEAHHPPRPLSPEEETLLQEGYSTLLQQGKRVTLHTLSQETGISQQKAATYLRTLREKGEHQQNRGYNARTPILLENPLPLVHQLARMVQ